MAFDLTDQTHVATLTTHLATPDTVKALDVLLKNRDDSAIADWYNAIQDTLAIPRGVITRSTFAGDCQRVGVWAKLMQLQQTNLQAFSGWSFYLDKILPLLDDFDVSGETFQSLLPQLKADGLIDDTGIAFLTTQPGTPAEMLFGAGSTVNTSAISQALGPVEVTP